jgi:hypothetical protein
VECFAGDDDSTPVDDEGCEHSFPSFLTRSLGIDVRACPVTTETFQAQYRVLIAFALFNVVLSQSRLLAQTAAS